MSESIGNYRTGGLALVFSGGGARAAYQIGVMQAVAELAPQLEAPILTGVSAGAINTLYLAGHPGPFRVAVENLRGEWLRLTPDRVYTVRPVSLGRSLARWGVNLLLRRRNEAPTLHGIMHMTPLRGFLDECMHFEGIRGNLENGRLRAVALSATCYGNGHTVTFIQSAEDVPLWQRHRRLAVRATLTLDHIMASAAIPIAFPAVRIGDGYYGDGSVRQAAPLAPAIHLGARKILAVAMRAEQQPESCLVEAPQEYPSTAQVLGLLLHSVFLDSLDADAERLIRINRLLNRLPRGTGDEKLRPVELMVIRPSRDLGDLAQGLVPKLPFLVRSALRSIGGEQARAAGLISYLMFQPEYTGLLMDLGYEDGKRQKGEIERFLEK